ncbi:uncharacterized protein N7529_005222 [Penicillium soppii]|uniref:uncharacterized protein n=1 Tax=Penicillium soppii TaxID=69789 RepID=UPI002548E1B9|nr:uncharacterized protein N7529_005222 [Penicillium soppii]KAJ5872869.1 hypothetical protein N7529_005222 [Penicillium soppii]
MPVYMLHGFRWPRAGFTGIRVYIVLHNLEEAAAEYIQQPLTTELLSESFHKTQADLVPRLPELSFIEQYDPADETSGTVSQDYAYVAARVMEIPDGGDGRGGGGGGGQNIEDVVEQGSGLTEDQTKALEELRDRLAPGEKIGWYLVYNGDPDRWYPESETESEFEYESEVESRQSQSQSQRQSQSQPQSRSQRQSQRQSQIQEQVKEESYMEPASPRSYTVTSWLSFKMVLSFILVQNRQGKTRLAKWYSPYSDEEKVKLKGEVHRLVAPRDQKYQSNFVEFRRSTKVVYRRYAGLFFCVCVDANDNELAYLEAIHFFVEVLDQFFGNVCELDLVFNFYKVYAILDEVFLAGEIQETSKQVVLTRLEHLDKLE